MERTITIDNKEYEAVYTALTGIKHRSWFAQDVLVERDKIQTAVLSKIDFTKKVNEVEVAHTVIESDKNEFLIKATYSCIRVAQEKNGKKFMSYEKWLESIDDYESLIYSAYIVYDMIAFGNRTVVAPDESLKEEVSEQEEKK